MFVSCKLKSWNSRACCYYSRPLRAVAHLWKRHSTRTATVYFPNRPRGGEKLLNAAMSCSRVDAGIDRRAPGDHFSCFRGLGPVFCTGSVTSSPRLSGLSLPGSQHDLREVHSLHSLRAVPRCSRAGLHTERVHYSCSQLFLYWLMKVQRADWWFQTFYYRIFCRTNAQAHREHWNKYTVANTQWNSHVPIHE